MADWLSVGEPPIDIRLRRDGRAKRLVLRVAGTAGAPVLTAPLAVAVADARRFAAEHEGWLRARLAGRPALAALGPGALMPVAGRPVRLAPGPRLRLDLAAGVLELPGPERRLPAQAGAFLRERARQDCAAAVERHAGRLGRWHGRLTLRDPRSRWGSCSSRGDLMFSWRLAMAPPEVLDYVAAHEVAHLQEMNHSSRFWAVVAALCPGQEGPRAWLRAHGAGLHRFDFRGPA